MVGELVKIIKEEEIDIIHARSRVPAWIAYFSARKTKIPFITTCHGYYSEHPFSKVMGWAKFVICISNAIARHMMEDFGVPYERIRLIHRGVDLERFEFLPPEDKPQEFRVGFIGRLSRIKGIEYFLMALAKARLEIPEIKAQIVGEGKSDYKDELLILTRRLGLSECVEFLGKRRDIKEILSKINLLVLPTITQEGFGRVIIEAGARGVPVIATRVGGVVDIIEDGISGILVPPCDSDALAEGIVKILKDKDLSLKFVRNLRQKIERSFNLEKMAEETISVYQEAKNLRILVIKLSAIGDVILSVPSLRAIRDRFPQAKICALTGRESAEILFHCPYIDDLIVYDFKGRDRGIAGILRKSGEIRKKVFDMVIDLQNNRRSHILSFLSFARDRYGYNIKGKFSFLLNHKVQNIKTPILPIEHQFRILSLLGIKLENPELELWPDESDQIYVDEFLDSHWLASNQKLIGINIGASKRWQTKLLPLECIAKLCEELEKRNLRVVITGEKFDMERRDRLFSISKNIRPIDAVGKTSLNQLAILIKRCHVYISCDSSPLHVASSVGTPFIALFGPTDPKRHMPPAKRFILIKKEISCSPCYKSKCKIKECMKRISAEEILKAVEELL
jgi:lipopolysaccharide heptosyltransferase II